MMWERQSEYFQGYPTVGFITITQAPFSFFGSYVSLPGDTVLGKIVITFAFLDVIIRIMLLLHIISTVLCELKGQWGMGKVLLHYSSFCIIRHVLGILYVHRISEILLYIYIFDAQENRDDTEMVEVVWIRSLHS